MLKRNVKSSNERERVWNVEQATIGALQNIVSRASLVTHPHPVMARTSRGQLQVVRLVRAMIHECHHPTSQFVAELPRKGEASHARERNWGSSHPRWDHQYRPPASPIPGLSVLRSRLQSTHSNGPDRCLVILPANCRCILRARHDHLPLLT